MKRFLFSLALLAYLPLAHTAHAQHVSGDIIAEYTFNEESGDTVGDSSGAGTPLDLTIRDAANVVWSPGYLTIVESTVVESLTAADKINNAVALGSDGLGLGASREISIEALIKPANNTQGGAARIVNIGTFAIADDGSRNRNVFLAQDKVDYDARLRTSASNDNGSNPQQQTNGHTPIAATPELQHVMFTRDADGNSFIYVNGIVRSNLATKQLGADLANWDPSYGLTIANEKNYGSDAGVRDFLGELHHVTIYSRALTTAEVKQNTESFGLAVIPEPTSMVLVGLGISLFGAAGRRRTAA